MKICGKYLLTTECIGQGSFSRVVKGTDEYGDIVAIKCIDWKYLKNNSEYKKIKESVYHEIECMKQLNNRHIVSFIDVEHVANWSEEVTYIVMEYCGGGDLSEFMRNCKQTNYSFTESDVIKILYCIAEGFLELRKKRLVHRDIKPANLFLTRDTLTWSDIKIGDFTFAKKEVDMTKTMCGSPLYMAPEVVLRKKYNEKADLWSIGVILFQMMYGRTPIIADSLIDLVDKIKNKELWKEPLGEVSKFSLPLRTLLNKIIVIEPADRIGFTEFFGSVRNVLLENARTPPVPIPRKSPSINSLSDYGGSYGDPLEKNIIISPRDVIALGFVYLRPPRTDPFKNMSYSEPKASKKATYSLPKLGATLTTISENDEYVILPRTIPENYVREINILTEISNILLSQDESSLALGVYCTTLRVIKAKIQSETKETSSYNILVDLYRSILSQAKVAGTIVKEKSVVDLEEEYIDVDKYLFDTSAQCIRCGSYKSDFWKLPFKRQMTEKELYFAAYSLLHLLEMDNRYFEMSNVLILLEKVKEHLNKL